MQWYTALFLVGIYFGPALGAMLGGGVKGARSGGVGPAVACGMGVALVVAFFGLFNAYIFYAGPVVGAAVAYMVAKSLR